MEISQRHLILLWYNSYTIFAIAAPVERFIAWVKFGHVGIGTTSPSYRLHVNGSGVGAYKQLSDERYKKDIADLTGSLQKILAIRGVTYKWIDEEKYGAERQIGVVAQEIEKIVPEVVTTGSDGIKRVKYSDLVPLLKTASP